MKRFKGKVALITGAASGFGKLLAEGLAAEGALLVMGDRNKWGLRHVAPGAVASYMRCDVTQEDRVKALCDLAIEQFGRLDIAVNNAGVDQHAFFTETTEEDWRRLLAVNLEAVFTVTHAVLPAMQTARFGRIVNIGSEAGRLGSKGGSVYAAAKGGMIAFTKSIARENARYGITVNNILPGPIDTPLLQRAVEEGGGKLLTAMENATLLRRLGAPEDVASAVAFIASREAGYITGETLGVSGGMGLSQG